MAQMIARCFVVVGALALASCSASPDAGSQTKPTALVKLATATTGNVETMQTLFGAVEQNAATRFTLSAPMEATVARIAAPVGSSVGPASCWSV